MYHLLYHQIMFNIFGLRPDSVIKFFLFFFMGVNNVNNMQYFNVVLFSQLF